MCIPRNDSMEPHVLFSLFAGTTTSHADHAPCAFKRYHRKILWVNICCIIWSWYGCIAYCSSPTHAQSLTLDNAKIHSPILPENGTGSEPLCARIKRIKCRYHTTQKRKQDSFFPTFRTPARTWIWWISWARGRRECWEGHHPRQW